MTKSASPLSITLSKEVQQALLHPRQSVPLLQALHILTREAKLNQDSRRKLKQVRHLVQFIEQTLKQLPVQDTAPVLADIGAGKSYLGFILYDLWLRLESQKQHLKAIYCIESRAELVAQSQAIAQQFGFDQIHFMPLQVHLAQQHPSLPGHIDIVTALHACDSATDDAIEFALNHAAKAIILVPCCHAEAATILRKNKTHTAKQTTAFMQLWRHPLHTREFGSQITNVLRCLYLEALGYQVTVTELVGWEHSLKNELIIARYTGQKKYSSAIHLRTLLTDIGLQSLLPLRFSRLSTVFQDTKD